MINKEMYYGKKHGSFIVSSYPGFTPDDIVVARDSNYILAGKTGEGFQLLKLDRNGDTLWTRIVDCNYNYCTNHKIVSLEDGFVVGYVNSDANHDPNHRTQLCVLTKYDYQGNELWSWQNDSSILYRGAEDLIQSKDKGRLGSSDRNRERDL